VRAIWVAVAANEKEAVGRSLSWPVRAIWVAVAVAVAVVDATSWCTN